MSAKQNIALALLASCCLPVLAQEGPIAEKPPVSFFKPGAYLEATDRVMMQPCKRWQVKQSNSDGMMISQCNDIQLYRSVENNFNMVKMVKTNGDVLVEFKPFMPDVVFPLEVGKKWTGEYTGYSSDNGIKWDSKLRCEATAFEKIKVAAGEFDAFRIDCIDNWKALFVLRGEKRSTRWYAPKINSIVSMVHDDPKWAFQLASYKVD